MKGAWQTEVDTLAQEVERSVSLLEAILESTTDGILAVDREGRIVAYNQRYAEMWRLPKRILDSRDDGEALRHVLGQLEEPDAFLAKVQELYEKPDLESHDVIRLADGRCFERYSRPQRIGGRSVGRVSSFRDVTARKRAEALIRHRAYHDDLTDLPNRRLFKDRLRKAIGQAQRTGRALATLFLDVDRFKMINETLGHAAGDQLLREVADRLRSRRRAGDTVARLGGDEFLILIQNLRHPEDAALVAEIFLDTLRPPLRIEGHELHVTASIGISLYPHDGSDVETLIRHADVAMYRAKAQGRNTHRIYAPEMNARAFEFLMLENRLRRALERQEFVLHYQPQIGIGSGEVKGIEALVRWRQDDGELLAPDDFISIAEENGQIVALGEWVLATACREATTWSNGTPMRLAVNLSAHELRRPGFPAAVAETIRETGIDPRMLELELTESAIIQDPNPAIRSLWELREMGARIAIDDFGTGHSSLAYLRELPIDTLKIDRLFIRDCRRDSKGGAIVAAIIRMAHSLALKVVAEGVETPEQMDFLSSVGCDEMQGFLFSPPLAASDLERFFAESHPWSP